MYTPLCIQLMIGATSGYKVKFEITYKTLKKDQSKIRSIGSKRYSFLLSTKATQPPQI